MAGQGVAVIDLVLQIETVARGGKPEWRVQAGAARELIPPLTDEDLCEAARKVTPAGQPSVLPPLASTWDGLLTHLGPNDRWRLNARILELVGKLLHDHLIRGKLAEHVGRLEARAREKRIPLRYVVHVFEGEEDGLLRRLPFELLHHGSFWFRRAHAVGVRLPPVSEACDVRLEPGASVLIAAAHADGREPSAAQLAAHVDAVTRLAERAGFAPRALPECTPAALEAALQEGCDLLYVVCHGEEDLDRHGRLALRGGDVTGRQLGEWLEAADASGRRTQAALLCACSSAVPGKRPGTMGMAEHLAATGRRASAALGFRAPVQIAWALAFTTEVFAQLAAGRSLEVAVATARRKQPEDDSQWALPLMFAHERDPFGPGASMTKGDSYPDVAAPILGSPFDRHQGHGHADKPAPAPPPSKTIVAGQGPPDDPHQRTRAPAAGADRSFQVSEIRTLLPTTPRPYFTGRQEQLDALRAWRAAPRRGSHAVLVGEGGAGKSELARVFAHEAHEAGAPVLWLERPDADLGGCLATMLRQHDPAYQPRDGATLDDLRTAMTRALGPHPGVLVLDDVEQASTVEALTPGKRWKVLVTTRRRALVPAAEELALAPLVPDDAIALLAALAREGEPFPSDEAAAARELADALGGLPLALELAGALLRRGASLDEMWRAALASGHADVLGRIARIVARSLAGLEHGDEAAWTLIAALPIAGATAADVARGLEEPEGRAARRLFRLRQAHLVRFQTQTGRYAMHTLTRQIARSHAERRGDWDEALARAARAAASDPG